MLSKEILKLMAEAERMMDEGTIPFVMAPGPNGIYERFALNKRLMEEYELKQGQTINTILRDALIEDNLKALQQQLKNIRMKIDDDIQQTEDLFLEDDFDFRRMMEE